MGFCAILWTMKMLNEAVGKMWRRILMKKVLIYNIILYLAYCCKKTLFFGEWSPARRSELDIGLIKNS